MGGARVEVFPDEAGEHRWRLVSANGEKQAASEGYSGGPRAAERGARDAAETFAHAQGESDVTAERCRRALRVKFLDADGALGFTEDELKGTADTGATGEYTVTREELMKRVETLRRTLDPKFENEELAAVLQRIVDEKLPGGGDG